MVLVASGIASRLVKIFVPLAGGRVVRGGGSPAVAAQAAGSEHGKSQKLETKSIRRRSLSRGYWYVVEAYFAASFMSIHKPSTSMPVLASKNSLSWVVQYLVALGWNQSGNTVGPGQTTPWNKLPSGSTNCLG